MEVPQSEREMNGGVGPNQIPKLSKARTPHSYSVDFTCIRLSHDGAWQVVCMLNGNIVRVQLQLRQECS